MKRTAGRACPAAIWHLLSDPAERYVDLGPDFYDSKSNKRRCERDLVRQLEHLTTATVAPT
jgi:transposase